MQKSREVTHLKHFKEVCSFFPNGEIENAEKPDFIIRSPDKLLGIEHTEIFQPGSSNGASLQAQDRVGQEVAKKAHTLYLERPDLQPFFVQILFNDKILISKKDIDRLANAVVNILKTISIEPGDSATIKRTQENLNYFPVEISMIHLYAYLAEHREQRWSTSSAGWVPEVSSEYVQEKIDQKEQKLNNYKSVCSEVWLLIVADDLRIPASIDLTDLALKHQYVSKFDRVFLFWNSTRRYVELQIGSS